LDHCLARETPPLVSRGDTRAWFQSHAGAIRRFLCVSGCHISLRAKWVLGWMLQQQVLIRLVWLSWVGALRPQLCAARSAWRAICDLKGGSLAAGQLDLCLVRILWRSRRGDRHGEREAADLEREFVLCVLCERAAWTGLWPVHAAPLIESPARAHARPRPPCVSATREREVPLSSGVSSMDAHLAYVCVRLSMGRL
jgi:hypothetical protein